MQIVVNEQLKDAIEWTCKYANEYKADIDIHIDAEGEVSVSICPTYRDTADTPQTDRPCDKCEWHKEYGRCIFEYCHYEYEQAHKDTPQTERSE